MNFDPRLVPFSRYGSYIAFSHLPKSAGRSEGLYLRSVHGCIPGPQSLQEVFRLQLLLGGQPIPFTELAFPERLRLEVESGYAEICIPEPGQVRIKGIGVGLRLSVNTAKFDNAIPGENHRWHLTVHSLQVKYMLTPIRGSLVVDAPWRVDTSDRIVADFLPEPDSGVFECVIEEFKCAWQERDYAASFEACLKVVEEEYRAWLDRMPQVPDVYAETRKLAAYINWSCVVSPGGYLTRPAMLMSKNWMTSVWSWDNCFNALALVFKHPELAWDQFMLMIDNQDVSGAFPDLINDRLAFWSFCKPPIQGWTLRRMMEHTDFITGQRVQEVYEPLCRWTQWWLDHRDDDGDGVPQYNHGNDSGWDNSTVFATRPPIESPDLSAYLIVQMDVLADLAHRLGRVHQATEWQARADDLLEKMLAHFWRGNRFVALRAGDHQVIEADSLLLFLPIVLGKRLPQPIRARLIAGLRAAGRFLTEHGLASESLSSPLYEPDGYWRGPIWGAATMLIVDGLKAAGELQFARELSRKFCGMAARSGLAENYDALTGEGLRDRAYTWTSSIFLFLAHELLEREGDKLHD